MSFYLGIRNKRKIAIISIKIIIQTQTTKNIPMFKNNNLLQ